MIDETTDPFEVKGEIPEGRAYQWVTLTVGGADILPHHDHWLDNGWTIVPPERHPKMSSVDDRIVVLGQVLLENSKEYVEAARRTEEEKARAFAQIGAQEPLAHDSKIRMISPAVVGDHGSWAQLKKENDDHLKQRADSRYTTITMTIGIVVTDAEIEASAYLGLDIREYARRKFLMRASVLQRINNRVYRDPSPDDPPIFSFVKLTTKEEYP